MSAPASTKEELHALIETMSPEEAELVLDFVNMRLDPDELSPEDEQAILQARAERDRDETMSHEALKAEFGL